MGKKLTALVLVMCVILTSLVIPMFSTDNDTADATPFVLLNRDFEDKTVVNNGFTGIQVAGNTIKLLEENGNTYMYWCADSKETTNHGHFNIDVSNYLPDPGSLVLKFKVRTDDVSSSIRPVLQVRPYDYHNASSITGKDGNPLVYKADMYNLTRLGGISSSAGYVAGLGLFLDMVSYRADEFVEVAYVFTWTNKTDAVCYVYYGGSTTPSATFTMQSNYGYDTRPCYFRFQVQNSSGLSWDMYDLKLYMLTTTDRSAALSAQIPDSNRGALSYGKRS